MASTDIEYVDTFATASPLAVVEIRANSTQQQTQHVSIRTKGASVRVQVATPTGLRGRVQSTSKSTVGLTLTLRTEQGIQEAGDHPRRKSMSLDSNAVPLFGH